MLVDVHLQDRLTSALQSIRRAPVAAIAIVEMAPAVETEKPSASQRSFYFGFSLITNVSGTESRVLLATVRISSLAHLCFSSRFTSLASFRFVFFIVLLSFLLY